MDKHVEKNITEEQLDWVQQLAPTHLVICLDEAEQPTQDFSKRAFADQQGAALP